VPAGFPPLFVHSLDVGAAPAPCAPQVGGVRKECETLPSAQMPADEEPFAVRRAWLAALGAGRDHLAFLAASHEMRVQWHSRELLRSQVRLRVHSFDAPFALLVRDLERAHALTAAEAHAARPQIALTIVDSRGNRSQALPTAAELLPPAR